MELEQRFNSQNDKLENTGNSCLKSIAENSDMFLIWTEILDDIINDLFLELSNKNEDSFDESTADQTKSVNSDNLNSEQSKTKNKEKKRNKKYSEKMLENKGLVKKPFVEQNRYSELNKLWNDMIDKTSKCLETDADLKNIKLSDIVDEMFHNFSNEAGTENEAKDLFNDKDWLLSNFNKDIQGFIHSALENSPSYELIEFALGGSSKKDIKQSKNQSKMDITKESLSDIKNLEDTINNKNHQLDKLDSNSITEESKESGSTKDRNINEYLVWKLRNWMNR